MTIRTPQWLFGGALAVLTAAGCSGPTAPTSEIRDGYSASGLGYGSGHEAAAADPIEDGTTTAGDTTVVARGGLGYGSGH